MRSRSPSRWACLLLAGGAALSLHGADSALGARGYTVLPPPQQVRLHGGDLEFGGGWRLAVDGGIPAGEVAVQSLQTELRSRFHLKLAASAQPTVPGRTLALAIRPHAVAVGHATDRDTAALAEQAYQIDLTSNRGVTIAANAATGLFYGVQTFLQLLQPRGGRLWLPRGEIVDWPDLELRVIYWDDAHHLERLDVLKAALRQAAFFKINGFAIKLEGHFQFHHAPAIVEPYALSPAQLQELTDYARRYHIQLIPYLDGPAHDAFILKHPEYAPLREFPDSNYEFCVVNPATYRLFFGLFDDLLDANRGGKYFVLSTDEPYYVGLADSAACDEAARARQSGGVGKLLAEFITRTAAYLRARGRTVLFWGEYPLKPGDIAALPAYLVNAETYGPKFDPVFKAHGIRQLIYVSTQGVEPLFPDYYPLPASEWLHRGPPEPGRLEQMFRAISFSPARHEADLMGAFVAAWADAGLHPATFWLGYATGSAVAWHPAAGGPRELARTFYRLFYGSGAVDLDQVYRLMSQQARFWDDSWETKPSHARKPIFGNSYEIFHPRRPADDQTLPPLPVPAATDLRLEHDWAAASRKRLQLAGRFLARNDQLLHLLHENLHRVRFNRYSLRVFVSIAGLCRQNLEMLLELGQINRSLETAQAAAKTNPSGAVAALDRALNRVMEIRRQRDRVLGDAVRTWYQTWFPRVAEANGRRYLNQVDDVKDHLPVRTVDMSYLVYRELLYPLGQWAEQVRAVRNQFATAHHLPTRDGKLTW